MHHSVSEYNTNKQDISDLHECETPELVFVNICEQPELIILKAKKSSTKIENCEKIDGDPKYLIKFRED